MRRWEGGEQYAHTQHQPGFIGIPKGADAGDHHIFVVIIGKG